MLNRGPVSWYSKRQSMIALFFTKAKYIGMLLVAKEAIWLRLLLAKLNLLQLNKQHALIKIFQNNTCLQSIHENLDIILDGEETTVKIGEIIIPLKGDNQWLIALVYNLVFYSKTIDINIQYHYICNEVASQKIELPYVLIKEMIADGLIKALTYVKFHCFIEQMNMT